MNTVENKQPTKRLSLLVILSELFNKKTLLSFGLLFVVVFLLALALNLDRYFFYEIFDVTSKHNRDEGFYFFLYMFLTVFWGIVVLMFGELFLKRTGENQYRSCAGLSPLLAFLAAVGTVFLSFIFFAVIGLWAYSGGVNMFVGAGVVFWSAVGFLVYGIVRCGICRLIAENKRFKVINWILSNLRIINQIVLNVIALLILKIIIDVL